MARMTRWIMSVALVVLPRSEQNRFRDEWTSETAVVREQAGDLATLMFALRLLFAAPRITMEMRAEHASGYAELSIGLLVSIFPSTVLICVALFSGVWILVLGEVAIVAGILLMASGFWSAEARVFDSTRSRVGIALAAIGSGIEIAVRRITGFGPPIDAVVSATIPHAVIMLGLILWVVSSYAGRFRFRVLMVGIGITAPAAALNMIVAVINGMALSGFDRFGVLMYVLPSAALAWACYAVVGRRKVFDDQPLAEVVAHEAA